jgi:hypothetical protein
MASRTCRLLGQALGGMGLFLGGGWCCVVCAEGFLILGTASLWCLAVLWSLGFLGLALLIAGACLADHAFSHRSRACKVADHTDGYLSPEITEQRPLAKPSASPLVVKAPAKPAKNTTVTSAQNTRSPNPLG